MGGWTLGMADSWGDRSSVRAASITEHDGKEVVDEDDSCVEIASVTPACRRARKLACRLRPEARPSGERPYTRLAARCFARRRDPAQSAHRAPNEAHPPQKTFTSPQPTQRPNRPSTRRSPSQGAAGRRGRSTAPSSTAGALFARAPRRLGGQDPSLHLLQPAHLTSSTPVTATTLQDEQASRSSSEFRGTRRASTTATHAAVSLDCACVRASPRVAVSTLLRASSGRYGVAVGTRRRGSLPAMCVNPRKSNVSGRRPRRSSSPRANRPNRNTRVFSGWSSRPNFAMRAAKATCMARASCSY
jgi:hypothetical protein